MRNNTKQIIAITAFVTFAVCFSIAGVGFIYQHKKHEASYSDYRKLERKFYESRLSTAKSKLKANCDAR